MQTISFMTANYVARQVNYHMTEGWMQGDGSTQDYFRPIETFSTRFEAYLRDIQAMGFEALDIWLAILNPQWATPAHIQAARQLLDQHDLKVTSVAGWFGGNRDEFTAVCEMAVALGTDVLGGGTGLLQNDHAFLVETLTRHNLRFGLENHPEKTPQEVLAKLGDTSSGRIGVAVDTGWFGTQGYDAAQALEELAPHLVYVHLKDVLAAGAHETCRYGLGVVPLQQCVETLKQIGYTGALSVEHEPEHYDPTEDCKASLHLLKEWLS